MGRPGGRSGIRVREQTGEVPPGLATQAVKRWDRWHRFSWRFPGGGSAPARGTPNAVRSRRNNTAQQPKTDPSPVSGEWGAYQFRRIIDYQELWTLKAALDEAPAAKEVAAA